MASVVPLPQPTDRFAVGQYEFDRFVFTEQQLLDYGNAREAAALKERNEDTDRLNYLALNPKGAQITIDGVVRDCIFWGISSAPEHTLREAIDGVRGAKS